MFSTTCAFGVHASLRLSSRSGWMWNPYPLQVACTNSQTGSPRQLPRSQSLGFRLGVAVRMVQCSRWWSTSWCPGLHISMADTSLWFPILGPCPVSNFSPDSGTLDLSLADFYLGREGKEGWMLRPWWRELTALSSAALCWPYQEITFKLSGSWPEADRSLENEWSPAHKMWGCTEKLSK